ncbi:SAM-dependent methyltransferase, partial [Candidatus Bathyarchaeota archaeon]|nr:SAM-dependent methyltransferase [Candidatus Bathyarchaeota archaeon]
VEVKTPEAQLDVGQAESYAQQIRADYFTVTNGETWLWYKTGTSGQGSSQAIKFEVHPPKTVGKQKLVKFETISEANNVIGFLHDIIWNEKSTTPEDALKELTKFFIAKIIDEQEVNEHEKEEYDFRIKAEKEDVLGIKNRINFLLLKAKKKDDELFVDPKPEITLKPYSVIKIVQRLQDYSLTKTDTIEILGEVYQNLLKETYTDKIKGQRFTPRNIVDFMVHLIDPKISETIYDPACGTCGFLVSALKHVKREFDLAFERNDLHNPLERYKHYATTKLFGTDIETTVVQLAKANMLVHGDGHNHIIVHDGLYSDKAVQSKTLEIQKVVETEGGFDIILTNPPFGGVKIDPELLAGYQLAKRAKSELTQVLFIERCITLLKKGGRMAIILPDGILNNLKLKYVREYVMREANIKAVISLPNVTFKPYGAGPKASILLLQKKKYAGEKQGNILMAEIKNIGYTVSGKRELPEDMPIILQGINKLGGLKW